jgi:hypothetical protein
MRTANLALRFLLELLALTAIGYWGATVAAGTVARAALVIALPLATAVFWGIFVAPRAQVVLPTTARMALGLLVFGCAAAALADRQHGKLALVFAVTSILNVALMLAWQQDRIITR